MSNEKQKQVVKISESDLVNTINDIVNEAVAIKKQEWINEQASKKDSLLETELKELKAQVKSLMEAKK